MKRICLLFCLLISVAFACQNKNNSRTKSVSDKLKTNSSDSSLTKKTEQDNYLIDNTERQDSGAVYMFCEKMPEYPGGYSAFMEYVKKNIIYPPAAISEKVEGREVIKFIVSSKGGIGSVKIIRSVRKDIDKECIRVISSMPDWSPGFMFGKPVSVSYSIPIRFLLNNSENLNGIFILPSKASIVIRKGNIP